MMTWRFGFRLFVAAAVTLSMASAAVAQVTPAAGFTPADDNPLFKVGATIFADYTYNESPTAKDVDGNTIHPSSFNVSRAYINVTGNLNHWISYRITPDVARESGSGSSLTGSQDFRLKYAFAQFSLDDWTTKGSWVRLGVQQTPLIDYEEQIYRYRFQGTTFTDREGFNGSSDAGLSAHWNFANNFGDVHGGVYNGEGYNKPETNDEKALMLRATVRPMPLGGVWKGLRLTAFTTQDHYVGDSKRQRYVGQVTFEHPLINAGVDYLTAKDRQQGNRAEIDAKGYSVWVTPRFGATGWEVLLRHDELTPNKSLGDQKRKRDIAGIAYWVPNLNKVSTAILLDYDSLKQTNFSPSRANDTRYGLKLLVSF